MFSHCFNKASCDAEQGGYKKKKKKSKMDSEKTRNENALDFFNCKILFFFFFFFSTRPPYSDNDVVPGFLFPGAHLPAVSTLRRVREHQDEMTVRYLTTHGHTQLYKNGEKKKGQQPRRMRLFTTRYYAEKSLQGAENSWRNKKKYTSEIFFRGRGE